MKGVDRLLLLLDPAYLAKSDLLRNLHAYFSENKDSVKMKRTFDRIVDNFTRVIENFSTESLLSIEMDTHGEAIHSNIIEEVKVACMNLIFELKDT